MRMGRGNANPLLFVCCAYFVAAALASAQDIPKGQLGPAPRITEITELSAGAPQAFAQSLPQLDRTNRQAVVDFYNGVYVPALAAANGWTGSVPSCSAGTTAAGYADATLDMVNYFRAMTGLPAAVSHEAVKDGKAQLAALMMTANNSLSHSPPLSWTCWTTGGAEAAGQSNLALGAAGAAAITLYMSDRGSGNTALGHRRWILYPRQAEMGTGSTQNANALWVIGLFGTRPATTEIVAWPPPGFVPYQLVYPRWSFSVNTGALVSFLGATVSMTRSGATVSLALLPNAVGYGDNTIAWEPAALNFTGGSDEVVSVQVSNVVVGGVATNYSYSVTAIDPAHISPPSFTDEPLLAQTTPVKTIHFTELRQAVNDLRARYGLAAYTWADASLMPGVTEVRAAQLAELRAALDAVYVAAGRSRPTYTAPTLIGGTTTIRAADIAELRAAVLAIW
jgi:hypothetical protein